LFAINVRQLETPPPGCEGVNTSVQRLKADFDWKICVEATGSRQDLGAARSKSIDTAPLSKLKAPTDASQRPEEWATLVAQVLCREGRAASAGAPSSEAEDALNVTIRLFTIATSLRRMKDINRVRHMTEHVLALGKHMVAKHPGEPASHLVLSQAYAWFAKNGYMTEDHANIEPNLQLALDAARRALILDPENEFAQRTVSSLQRKFAGIRTKR
jgi:hypothetical protein